MAVHYDKETGISDSDTEVENHLQGQDDDDEGRTSPFNEVERAEAAVERSRERVERSVTALRNELVRRTDWRGWVSRQPIMFLGAAVLLGFVWGYRSRGGRGSTRR
jgi:hypothetical protein